MDRAEEYIARVDDPSLPPLEPGHPADPALLAILVHVAYADGTVEEEEFDLLHRLVPDRAIDELMVWVSEQSEVQLDFDAMRAALPSESERRNALRFGARMAFSDGEVAPGESMVLLRVARALGLEDQAVREVVDEIRGQGGDAPDGSGFRG